MIKFEDFFKVCLPNKTKVKFNMNDGESSAWDLLKADDGTNEYERWIKMNAWKNLKGQANNNLNNADYLLAFAQYYPLGPTYFIFGGMYKVEHLDTSEATEDCVGYKLTLLDDFKEYRKRLIVKLSRTIGRDIYNKPYLSVQRDFNPEIYELLPTQAIDDFPGFNHILLTHKQLQYIFKKQAPEWEKQLSSVKGVYCITDTRNGKIYIGSAYGEYAGIWQRWSSYANIDNLTGGNKTFEEIKSLSPDYIVNNFQYSVLEILDPKTPNEEVIRREEFWKKVFKSKEFGMNN
ncbi:MAG: GIY-YIG nuclease family protein [Clostridia bacterium]|nr:GIY-YIG nuclease family protein [Clostridia bacterium]